MAKKRNTELQDIETYLSKDTVQLEVSETNQKLKAAFYENDQSGNVITNAMIHKNES